MKDTYTIVYWVSGHAVVEVEADSKREALDKGNRIMRDVDFGELEEIEYNPYDPLEIINETCNNDDDDDDDDNDEI